MLGYRMLSCQQKFNVVKELYFYLDVCKMLLTDSNGNAHPIINLELNLAETGIKF